MQATTENVNDIYFDGMYKDIWKSLIPDKLTAAEVQFLIDETPLIASSKVLDMMCGYGRHSIALARKGYQVTAVDNLESYITEIATQATAEHLPIKYIKEDILNFCSDEQFDLAICMGNSICFFNEADTLKLLSNLALQVKPGGKLVINSWCIAEIAIKNFVPTGSGKVGTTEVLTESQFLFHPTRIETLNTFIAEDGTKEFKKAVDYIYSYAEMEKMLQSVGFSIKSAYSIPGKKIFSFGEPRLYLVAEKN
jgi:2-polyprenyl-3-methyl-5-hydroxy-6-metoxy-1,4-benzoquinol methylase